MFDVLIHLKEILIFEDIDIDIDWVILESININMNIQY